MEWVWGVETTQARLEGLGQMKRVQATARMSSFFSSAFREHSPAAVKVSSQQGYVTSWRKAYPRQR